MVRLEIWKLLFVLNILRFKKKNQTTNFNTLFIWLQGKGEVEKLHPYCIYILFGFISSHFDQLTDRRAELDITTPGARITNDLKLCNCASKLYLFTVSWSYSYKSPTHSSAYGFHLLCRTQKITITVTIIPMTISSRSSGSAAAPIIKRQSLGKTGTNSGMWSGGPWKCEKVNTASETLHGWMIGQMRL